ncbi:MAG TPA: glycosyltransferase [Chthoniobacterales bacterium]|nr:glycosyltransferase [Chthoniobacterales bacterium]
MPDGDDHFRDLNAELDRLRASLIELRQLLAAHSAREPTLPAALESANKQLHSIKTLVRLLQTESTALEARLERAVRETWNQKARRAEATARLKSRESLLEEMQRSAAWKAVKPLWKLFHRSRKSESPIAEGDLEFGLDLPAQWKTSREILLIKGFCYSRSGKQIAGVRAKIGSKGRLARYGLERPELALSLRDSPLARHSGFTIEIRVPPGTSTVRLEAIEQGADWQPFFEHQLEREKGPGSDEESADDETTARENAAREQLPRLGPLSADKAFERLKPIFQTHAGRLAAQAEKPLFSLITPAYNTKPEWLAEAALSLLNQSFANWEWCIVDDGSQNRQTKKLLEHLSRVSPRVRIEFAANAGISAATNQALDLAQGDYVCFLDHDDLLHWPALESMAEKIREGYDVVYSDEDKLDDATGELVEPFFKPAWSPEYFRGVMYVGHLLCVRREIAVTTRFDSAFDGVQDFEFMLRVSEAAARIGHIPRILYHWRKTPGSIAEAGDAKPQIGVLQQSAVNAHLRRLKLPAQAQPSDLPHRLQILPEPRTDFPSVSLIIPTKDAPEMLGRCLESISKRTSYSNFEVILMDNETTEERSLQLMQQYPVRRIPFPDPFNFSRANNQGATAATGEFLVFLNNDVEIITEDWLQHLLYYAEQPEVGAAGALLIYEDRTVQHAGVALGMRGTADHTMRGFPIGVDGYAGSLACAREVSAVTAACLMIRKSLFHELGGFSEHFFTAYQDVDLCLRLRERGLRLICTPRALVIHHESVSRRKYYDMIDRTLLLDQWESIIERGDPYYNPNLNLERGDYSRRSA